MANLDCDVVKAKRGYSRRLIRCGQLLGSSAVAILAVASFATPALAQQNRPSVSQPVMQAVPPRASGSLNDALGRLARNPRDLEALIDAGNASLRLDDVDAAIGFFGRADELSPDNARIKAGLAGAYVHSGKPVEAMALFSEAEAAGGSAASIAAERGLAFDLIGDPTRAQSEYRRAMAADRSDDTLRRLAISLAISGNKRGFEEMLRPLIAKRDFAAYRARAFGLAILGEGDDAVAITEAVMARETAGRIEPYLRYMPQLTRAQQAAAANLGIFPRAAQIGRDDPQFAEYRESTSNLAVASADSRLAPSGPPMGSRSNSRERTAREPREDTRSQRRRPGSGSGTAGQSRSNRRASSDPLNRTTRTRVPVSEVAQTAAPVPVSAPPPPPPPPPPPVETRVAVAVAPTPTPPPPSDVSSQVARPSITVAKVNTPPPSSAAQTFDLANVSGSNRPAETAPASVADAFGGFTLPPSESSTRAANAVDITAIEPPRETTPEPEAAPAVPTNPRRFWVQIATGRDRSALRFDWRRFSRAAPDVLRDKGPFVASWNQTNRLLAGPFDSARAARDALNTLKAADVDGFTYRSLEGEEIEDLQ